LENARSRLSQPDWDHDYLNDPTPCNDDEAGFTAAEDEIRDLTRPLWTGKRERKSDGGNADRNEKSETYVCPSPSDYFYTL
jgi:hypothetical protein